MELLLSLAIMALPNLAGGYYAYVLSKVRGYNVLTLTAAGLAFGPLVPLFIYLVKPKEQVEHPWYPEDKSFGAPALMRYPSNGDSFTSVSGHIYLEDERLIWIPKSGDALEWDYVYAIHNGSARTFKSERLTWLLLPNPNNQSKPYAISLGSRSGLGRLNMAALQNVIINEDKELFDKIMNDLKSNSRWLRKGNNGK
jgi:hypothetical protein